MTQLVVNKERGEEKGKSPHSPLKEKEGEKEIYPSPSPSPRAGAREGAGCRKGKGEGKGDAFDRSIEIRPRAVIHVNDGFILNSECDSVEMALAILRIPQTAMYRGKAYNNPRIMRTIRNEIGDDVFREVLVRQWHENCSDGEPRSRAAAFMAKLNAVRDGIHGVGGRGATALPIRANRKREAPVGRGAPTPPQSGSPAVKQSPEGGAA